MYVYSKGRRLIGLKIKFLQIVKYYSIEEIRSTKNQYGQTGRSPVAFAKGMHASERKETE